MFEYFAPNQASIGEIQIEVVSDGTQSVLEINVSKSPFNVNYNGVLPAGFNVDTGVAGITATASIASTSNGDVVTVTFSSAPPADTDGFTLTLYSLYDNLV